MLGRIVSASLLSLGSTLFLLGACSGSDDEGGSTEVPGAGGTTVSSGGASKASKTTATGKGGNTGSTSRTAATGGTGKTSTSKANGGGAAKSGSNSSSTVNGAAGAKNVAGASGSGNGEPCTDEYPFDDGYTCVQQASWGKCTQDWMKNACNLSCGRCGDASAVPEVAASECGDAGTPPDLSGDAGTAPSLECAGTTDECPMTTGLSYACKQRFALGINYAWRNFGSDFGGLEAWSLVGPSGSADAYNADLARMRANGASVVRWWMFPDLRGDGIEMDGDGNPTGITDTAVADIEKALELAQRNDLYVVFTLFSFDAFRRSRTESKVEIPGLTPIVTDADRRAKLIANVVRPVAKAVADSKYSTRMLGWDVINEPEWAIKATGSHDQDFSPNSELDAVPLDDMKALINESLTVLEEVTPRALRSVGWAAAKWSWAFTDVTKIDFNQPHIYGWVNDYWPYTTAPADLGYKNDRPVVMGEFYLLPGPFEKKTPTFSEIVQSWYKNGYAGAWAWDFYSGCGPNTPTVAVDLRLIKQFSDDKGCSVSF
ncbi:MAG: hypothetical protein ACM3ZE_11325 [Myxococcales bacterium]